MRIKNLPSISSMDGSQDALVIEQTDGSEDKSRKVSPAQIKQYVLGNSIDDVYSVMGEMGAKNLNSYPYNETSHTDNGIVWTDNGDGTVVANNTATGNSAFVCHSRVLSSVNKLIVPNGTYILSGCPSGGSSTTFNIGATITKNGSATAVGTDNGSGTTITINGDDNYTDKAVVQIICNIKSGVAASSLTFKPMLRLASDTDDTYQPYAKTNKQLTEDKAEVESVRGYINELGVKNLIPYPYYESSYTENGITWTVNADGTITADGTAEANEVFVISYNFKDLIKEGTDLILSGCPTGGSASTYKVSVDKYVAPSFSNVANDFGSGVQFKMPTDGTRVRALITIYSGTTVTNLIFKPMLRLASDINDDTYVPYAKTNKELTDAIGDLSQTGLTGDSVAEQLATAGEQISDLTTKKFNTWMPDVYDFNTKVKTLDPSICATYVQKIGDLTVAYLGVDSGTNLGSFSTMMQLRGFPEGCTRCIGGYIYNSNLESPPRVVQASNVGVYFRPNITGNMSSGFVSALLFFN